MGDTHARGPIPTTAHAVKYLICCLWPVVAVQVTIPWAGMEACKATGHQSACPAAVAGEAKLHRAFETPLGPAPPQPGKQVPHREGGVERERHAEMRGPPAE